MILRHCESFRWEGVNVHPYKEEGTHFKSITRQTLVVGAGNLPVEFRYFEIAPGGHSTLERHDHQHMVMVVRGSGRVLVGSVVDEIGLQDVVHVPPQTWHQFRAGDGDYLGFLCVVATDRDRPYRPSAEDAKLLRANPEVAEFIKL